MSKSGHIVRMALILLFACAANLSAKYSGRPGEPNGPFEIGTVADWQHLMDTPADWDKHLVLTGDIDVNGVALSPVGDSVNNFTGIFNGNDHIIRNADINMPATDYVGLFGYVGRNGHIASLGVENIAVKGKDYVGGLAGYSDGGNIVACYTTGSVGGVSNVGGLIGYDDEGIIIACYSAASVIGSGDYIGGLVGYSDSDTLNACYATGEVRGNRYVGGLLGTNGGTTTACYATGAITGDDDVGGLVGYNAASIYFSYSTGLVSGNSSYVGGLVGRASPRGGYSSACFWDKDTSGWTTSAGGEGKTTAEMQDPNTFLLAGWDFTDTDGDLADWFMPENDYPQLPCSSWIWAEVPDITGMSLQDAAAAITNAGFLVGCSDWTVSSTVPAGHIISHYPMAGFKGLEGITEIDTVISIATEFSGGDGSEDDPYQIRTAAEWALLADRTAGFWDDHLILMGDIDFAGTTVCPIGGYDSRGGFVGCLDGNGHVISNIRVDIPYADSVGLFGSLSAARLSGEVRNLGVENISVAGYKYVGGLVGYVGGGSITGCYVIGSVSGYEYVGGLFGCQGGGEVSACYAAGTVAGEHVVGGLGGGSRLLKNCYSRGLVQGETYVGGLVGGGIDFYVFDCFWDVNASGQSSSAVGEGKTTAEMKEIETYPVEWDFTTEDLDPADWVMPENDYPRLACEYWEYGRIPDINGMGFEEAASTVKAAGFLVGSLSGTISDTVPVYCVVQQSPAANANGVKGVTRVDMVLALPDRSPFNSGSGTEEDPYEITTVCDWLSLAENYGFWDDHFLMMNDLDFCGGAIPAIGFVSRFSDGIFDGVFDGNDHVIYNVRIDVQEDGAGLFRFIGAGGQIRNVTVKGARVDADIPDYTPPQVGGLATRSEGSITNCHVSGWVQGRQERTSEVVGGLVGVNFGSVTACSACCWVGNGSWLGGLVGYNGGDVMVCYCDGVLWGRVGTVGGLAGVNVEDYGSIVNCFATVDSGRGMRASVAGGLVGKNESTIMSCYAASSVSGYTHSGGLVGLDESGTVTASFWDVDTSGLMTSAGGDGKTTGQMQDPNTFISAGWDLVGETANGTEDIWSICEGSNYPRFVWQIPLADWVCPDGVGLEDFGHFGGYWGTGEGDPANLDGEEGIGFGDLMVFCEEWLVGR